MKTLNEEEMKSLENNIKNSLPKDSIVLVNPDGTAHASLPNGTNISFGPRVKSKHEILMEENPIYREEFLRLLAEDKKSKTTPPPSKKSEITPQKHTMKKALPLIAAACCLLATFAHLPYGFYQLLRWLVCATAITSAIHAKEQGSEWKFYTAIALAILFNPILPIHLSRDTWRGIDAISAILLTIFGLSTTKPTITK